MITDFHAKYYAHELSLQNASDGVERISQSLFDASVDLNPHQIEAALFALSNPLNKGVVLADEVGLGKTIEAGLVLCQLWAERKRQLLIICPASLRQQWAQELKEKFNLPTKILDAQTWRKLQKEGIYNPLNKKTINIMSFHYAARLEDKLVAEPWNLVVIDEAHKLRNAYRPSNKMGQALRRALDGRYKLLLTATPLQNSLLELYGISTLIDEYLFGDPKSFRKQYINNESGLDDLRDRLSNFIKRTLRKDVLEYVRYTDRKAITIPFMPSDSEQRLYDGVSALLGKEESYALPIQQRHLTGLILRKLLASSSYAVLNTLKAIKKRLEKLRDEHIDEGLFIEFLEDDDLNSEYLDELQDQQSEIKQTEDSNEIDTKLVNSEIDEIEQLIYQANNITADSKLTALIQALQTGFSQMSEMGAAEKAIIFTESRRTQQYIAKYLQASGYDGQFVLFSGTNNSPETTQIYQQWLKENEDSDKITGSPQIDRRSALIDYFKHHTKIMIATEAAAEGVNLQFCSLVINYDLPWNPQRIEQRIGRCHRYGQKFDVVVINFLNERNHADQRVLELLTEKFNLFDGVFGASDEVLGQIESGMDFEQRIKSIYDSCRLADEIEQAFDQLQKDLEEDINNRLKETQKILLENFDEEIHDLLKIRLDEAEQRLDKISRWFWLLTKHQLYNVADFDNQKHSFNLNQPVLEDAPVGTYQLIRANGNKQDVSQHSHTYRLTHPLGEYVLEQGCKLETPTSKVIFDYSKHNTKIAIAEQLQGQSGWLTLTLLTIESLQKEQYLIFTGITDNNKLLDDETCRKLFSVNGQATTTDEIPGENLHITSQRQVEARLSAAMEANNQFFQNEREKLEKWADDKILAAEQDLQDTKAKIRAVKRETRQAQSIEEQQLAQKQLQELERLQRRQRQQIFDVEDEIIEKRDELINHLEHRLQQRTDIKVLFTIRWQVE